jgi:hypothetical protein
VISKSQTFIMTIPGNQLYREAYARLLTSTHESWLGQKLEISVSHPQLNTIVFSIGPGVRRQELPRDDMNHHNELPALASHKDYNIGRDLAISFFVS